MAKNNFKELEKLLSENKEFTFEKVKNNIVSSRNLFGFIGDIIELFIPRIIDVFVGMAGGESESEPTSKYPHEGGNL